LSQKSAVCDKLFARFYDVVLELRCLTDKRTEVMEEEIARHNYKMKPFEGVVAFAVIPVSGCSLESVDERFIRKSQSQCE